MSRVSMPGPGYRRPDRVDESGLVVSVTGPDGQELGPFDFTEAPAHGQVRAQLVSAFVAATGPGGRWKSRASMDTAHRTVTAFLRSLDPLGIAVSSLAEFGPEAWWTWRKDWESRNRWPGRVNMMRVLLKDVPDLNQLTRRALAHRTHKPRRRLYGSYSVAEFNALRRRAAELVRATDARITTNVTALEQYRQGTQEDDAPTVLVGGRHVTRGELLDGLQRDGRLVLGTGARALITDVADLLATGDLHPTYALYPTRLEVLSLMVLLVCDRGYNTATMMSLAVPEEASATAGHDGTDEDPVLVVHLDKPRRGQRRFFTHTFTGQHARVLRSATSITAPARDCMAGLGHPTDQLLIAGTSSGVTEHPTRIFVTSAFTNGGAARRWDELAGVRGDDGEVLHVHLDRLRLSEQVINRKSSQNSPSVSEDVYRRPDPLTADMHRDVILDGQAAAVDHARETVRMRYADAQDLGLSEATAAAVEQSRLDTATGACLDFTHSPFTPHGQACSASFLNCMACPNAVATPAHLPRLLILAEALDNIASINLARFDRIYREHRQRLEHLLQMNTTEADRVVAHAAATDNDRALIERLLRRDLDA